MLAHQLPSLRYGKPRIHVDLNQQDKQIETNVEYIFA